MVAEIAFPQFGLVVSRLVYEAACRAVAIALFQWPIKPVGGAFAAY